MSDVKHNRSYDLPIDGGLFKGLELIDIDTIIFNHIKQTILPKLYQNGNQLSISMLYGNAERWTDIVKNGYFRDENGVVQVPLVVIKRGSIEPSSTIPYFKDGTVMPSISLYSNKNRYEKFNIQNDIAPVYEIYNIAVPNYVNITYDVVVLTSFTEHMNKILEQFQYSSERYWGGDDSYKFFTKVESLDMIQEVNDSEARVIKSEFSLSVNGFILPTEYKNKLNITKKLSSKKIITTIEANSGSGGFYINEFNNVKYKTVLANYYNENTLLLDNIHDIAENPKYKVYVNNIPVPINDVQYIYDNVNNKLIFTLTNKMITDTDTVFVKGFFII